MRINEKKVASFIIAILILSILAIIILSVSMAWFFFKSPPKTGGISENVLKSSMKGMMGYASPDDIPIRTPHDRTPLSFNEKDGVKEFRLSAEPIRWEYANGYYVTAWGFNGQVPGPEIRVSEGDRVRIIFTNNLPKATAVHWHGVNVPNGMDGVPGVTQEAVKPNETFVYEFTAEPKGTRYYHAHGSSHMDEAQQLDMGLYGAFIIEPSNFSEKLHQNGKYDKEFTLLLDEWEIMPDGTNAAMLPGMHSMDHNVFTINGRAFPDTEPLNVAEGDKVLVRIINAGSSTAHPMHLHGHSFKIVAVDGNPVQAGAQIVRDTLPVSPGERYDIEITAGNPGTWIFHCHELHHADGGMIIPFMYEGYDNISRPPSQKVPGLGHEMHGG
ncbi:MAG: multicopper oxidase domain-containing protein [Candidatus Aenigmarchaeota archaeon]|nr:multicopper oxidase domain-containing protein [Candidatus Aenigmarchaeota archaeon]